KTIPRGSVWRLAQQRGSASWRNTRRHKELSNWRATGKKLMTTFLLIRHGDTDAVGKVLAGWSPGWHLNHHGQCQGKRLSERLKTMRIGAVYTSPLERAVETAEPIARLHRLDVQKAEELGEMRIGEWEGLPFAELDAREDWRAFNTFRTGVRPPGGELMIE